jgi:hypothetical protein
MINKLKCDVFPNGDKCWHLNGLFHREDGPAIEGVDGYKAWIRNGKYHREDGPAIEWADGVLEWYLDGKYLGSHYRVNDLELQSKYPKLNQ